MGRTGSGVEIRDTSLRIKFVLNGQTIRERLQVNGKAMAPTPANVKYAERLSALVQRAIATNTFTFAEFFPDSKRAKVDPVAVHTLDYLGDEWLKTRGKLTAATKDQYGTAIRFWKRELGKDTPVRSLTHLKLASKIGSYPWPSAKTHNNYMIALRGIMDLEYRGADAASNPLIGIGNMVVITKLPDPFSIDERDAILADMRKHYDVRVYAYFLWMFFTGMRPEEAIALRWSDIDAKRHIARIQRVRTFKGSERDGSKTHTERDVDLMTQALQALAIMKPYTKMLTTERDGDADNAADIFQNPLTGRPWHSERSQRDTYLRPTLKRLGIRWRPSYNTRHTFATVALMTGAVPPAYIAAQLGHSVKMLLEKYARWLPANDKGTARALLSAAMAQSENPDSSQIRPKNLAA